MKSGNLNFLEPYGPLQACNGTALPLPLPLPLLLERQLQQSRNVRRYYTTTILKKVQLSVDLEQAMKAQTIELEGAGGQHHAPADLPPGKRPGTHYM